MFSAQFCTTFSCFCIAFFTCIIRRGIQGSMDVMSASDRLLLQVNVVLMVTVFPLKPERNYSLVTCLSCFSEIIFKARLFQGMQGG